MILEKKFQNRWFFGEIRPEMRMPHDFFRQLTWMLLKIKNFMKSVLNKMKFFLALRIVVLAFLCLSPVLGDIISTSGNIVFDADGDVIIKT